MAGIKYQNGEPKEYQNSIRYTKTVKNIISKATGENFNQKFENLCLDYEKSIPERTAKLKEINKEIANRENYLKDLRKKTEEYEKVKREFENFFYYIEQAKRIIK